MPVPIGPRRPAPPRKKVSKNAPTTALPEPPVEETVTVQSPPITDEPSASADRVACDATGDSQKETGGVAEGVEAIYDQHLDITAGAEQRSTPPPVSTETFHEPVEEPEKQEAEEELVGSHVEAKSTCTAADDQGKSSEQPPMAVEEEEAEKARRQRIAAAIAHLGVYNPPPISSRQSPGEPELPPSELPLDVEDEVNVDTEEFGETPPTFPARRGAIQFIKYDAAEPHVEADPDSTKVDSGDRGPALRDGES